MNTPTRIKQVIVIRADLKMRRGKEIAQGSHASMAFISNRLQEFHKLAFEEDLIVDLIKPLSYMQESITKPMWEWFKGSFAKVTCQVNSEEELREVYQKALDAGLEAHLIIDSGKTEFHGEATPTAVGIGPDYVEKFEGITDDLKLR
ncbi:MAG: aminoacyl-tRNA hydrolase [Candidatus Thorarchaeota archaeon]|jgi:PTH2 family peptidyl-tRNA hydrolase